MNSSARKPIDINCPPNSNKPERIEHGRPLVQVDRLHARAQRETTHQPARQISPKAPSSERRQPDRAQQVLRPLAEAGQKLHRQEVQEALDECALKPYFEWPNCRGRWSMTISPTRNPRAAASTGTKRCNSP